MQFTHRSAPLFAILIALAGVSVANDTQATWPQWRGPMRDGQIATAKWPESLDEDHLKQMWRQELGPSYSGPLVDADHVYTTETRDSKLEVVTALNRETGEEVWSTSWEGAMVVPFFAASNGSWIRSTPAIDDQSIYVAGMRDVLVCLDKQSGDERWKVDFVERYGTPVPKFGFVASPLIDDDVVYVQAAGGVVKVDKTTGESIWRSGDGDEGMNSAFSSPVIAEVAGKRQLVVQGREKLMGVDLESGEILWSQAIQAFRGMNILTPTMYNGSVFTSAHSGVTQLWDVGGDGNVAQRWKVQAQAYMSSPVIVDGHAYLHLKNQRLACIDLEQGEQKWRTKPFGKYWSMVAAGDRILALDENGTLRLIAADPEEYRLIDERKVSQAPAWAHLAVVGDKIFVRELEALAAYRWSD